MARSLVSAEAYDLAMHLIGTHRNAAAVHNSVVDNLDCHRHEHYGPGGLRNHPYDDHSYSPERVEETLEEAEEAEA